MKIAQPAQGHIFSIYINSLAAKYVLSPPYFMKHAKVGILYYFYARNNSFFASLSRKTKSFCLIVVQRRNEAPTETIRSVGFSPGQIEIRRERCRVADYDNRKPLGTAPVKSVRPSGISEIFQKLLGISGRAGANKRGLAGAVDTIRRTFGARSRCMSTERATRRPLMNHLP